MPAPVDAQRLSRFWLKAAQHEHASIASFSKFSLDLMALAAPPPLLLASLQAAADEVEHARICFAMASFYGRKSYGPGALSISGSVVTDDLATAAIGALKDGCIGETTATLRAKRCVDLAEDPVVRTAFQIISVDEATHAELAWKFVGWALQTGGNTVRRALHTALSESLDESRHFLPHSTDNGGWKNSRSEANDLEKYGLLSSESRAALAIEALQLVSRTWNAYGAQQATTCEVPAEPFSSIALP